MVAAALLVALGTGARADESQRYDAPEGTFLYPASWKAIRVSDVSAPFAVQVAPPEDGKPGPVARAIVLVSGKRVGDNELEAETADWHAAHLRNRVAWGVRSKGGLPREFVRAAGRRLVRFRDRVNSAFGANEQTLTCGIFSGHLACVITSASTQAREEADALGAALLASLNVHRK
jgi:hypothetical protein